MINLRKLFDQFAVEYRDRGPNTSRGHINVPCPWCGNDPSYHLGINESTGEYYCFRNPKHSGHNLPALFKRLNLPKSTYADLKLDDSYRGEYTRPNRDYSIWRYFIPAEESQEAVDYLSSRKFLDPVGVAKRFNLRVSTEGEWAGRLLIPLTEGWTGRAMRSHIEPRYDAYTSEDGYFFYSNKASSALILEGAIDGMRVASVTNQFDVFGKCRIAISAALLRKLLERKYTSIYCAPDSTVLYTQAREELVQVRSYCTSSFVGQIKTYKKDFGEMSESETRSLLSRVGYDSDRSILRQLI